MSPVSDPGRERENLLHRFEVAVDQTSKRPKADRQKCVKEYHRPTVGVQDTDLADIRPPEVLSQTLEYLVNTVAVLNVAWSEIYEFIFDRLRAVRQDLVMQQCADQHAVSILETAVRFHVYSEYRLCVEDISVFEPRINSQHSLECLKRLINLYQDSSGCTDTTHAHRPEFESVYLLYNLGDEDAMRHYLSLKEPLRSHKDVRKAYEMSIAFASNNWVQLLRKHRSLSSPIQLCAVHRHFLQIQRKALYAMNIGYSSKNCKYPLSKLTDVLHLNTDTHTQNVCQELGLSILGEHVQFLKGSWKADTKLQCQQSDCVSRRLKMVTIPNILWGCTLPLDTHHSRVSDRHTGLIPDSLCREFTGKCSTTDQERVT